MEIRVDAKRLEAHVDLQPGEARGPEELDRALRAARIKVGVISEVRERVVALLRQPQGTIQDELIARGREAEPGQDGTFEMLVNLGPVAGRVRDDDSIDFRDRKFLTAVREGETIARHRKPVPGRPGESLDGLEVPPPAVKDRVPMLGDGISENDEGVVTAARSGVLVDVRGQKLDVMSYHEHPTDVDMKTGHLEMIGSLSIGRDVKRNLVARSSGDVEVKGSVDGGLVFAEGSVRIHQGAIGGERGIVHAEGDIEVRHVQASVLEAKGRVVIIRDSVNARIDAHEIEVGGRVLGGDLRAEHRIRVESAGSNLGVGTRLSVGIPLASRVEATRDALASSKVKRARRRPEARSSSSRVSGKAGRRSRRDNEEAWAERRRLRDRMRELVADARIDVVGHANPGVQVTVGEATLNLEKRVENVSFRYDEARREVRVGMLLAQESEAQEESDQPSTDRKRKGRARADRKKPDQATSAEEQPDHDGGESR